MSATVHTQSALSELSYKCTCLLSVSSILSISSTRWRSSLWDFMASADRSASSLICSFICPKESFLEMVYFQLVRANTLNVRQWKMKGLKSMKVTSHSPPSVSDSSLIWQSSAPPQPKPHQPEKKDTITTHQTMSRYNFNILGVRKSHNNNFLHHSFIIKGARRLWAKSVTAQGDLNDL